MATPLTSHRSSGSIWRLWSRLYGVQGRERWHKVVDGAICRGYCSTSMRWSLSSYWSSFATIS
eukprot:10652457-Prorocentrum_lima.AAC.1